MSNVLTIFRREVTTQFSSALAGVVIPVFLIFVGVFSLFFQDIFIIGVAEMRSIFFWMGLFYLLLVPAITMRAFAEEKRTGTLEMLVTLPISEAEMVVGKYLASVAIILCTLVLSLTYPITLSQVGALDWGPVIGGYLGLALLGASFAAIGIAASAFAQSQMVAFMLSFAVCLFPFATGFALSSIPAEWLPLVQYLSFEYHFGNLAKGVVDSRNVIFYSSVIALFLHLAVFRLERRRLQ